ncbi:DUF3800 domain-containing protein [Mucilaginibacter gossypii]|uniref:DUF3800 domain-containing protein n=2 Tax=Mucilaginibacter TaxID=423349 RepID=A0A1G7XBU0_9SPHI|nr:DUF3800 domain-containing protein [Mucilaginibacter gossypii]SDG81666.1 Protein of unknown function [Mucilaginibacter gossypii]
MESTITSSQVNSDLNIESTEELDEKAIAKLKRIEQEKKELINNVVSGNIENIKDRVASILNNSTEARNSDTALAYAYWAEFEPENFNDGMITKDCAMKLTKMNSLSRVRAKIQNEYKLFQADEKIRKHRGVLEGQFRQEAIDDKPLGLGTYSVYIDETGKNQDYLSVGSLWILKSGYFIHESKRKLVEWKKANDINYEFHFVDISKHKIASYKEFFAKFLGLHPEVGFKIIVINNKGLANKNSAIVDLTYHLLIKGINHENDTGRAPLPRVLQVWIDEEETGSDQLKIENIKERIEGQKVNGLYFGDFQAVSSEQNFFIQIVDLFTGSINRKLNTQNGEHPKDEFADFVLNTINFDINSIDRNNIEIDNSAVFNLMENSQ